MHLKEEEEEEEERTYQMDNMCVCVFLSVYVLLVVYTTRCYFIF